MEEEIQPKKPKIYNKDLKEAVEYIKEEVHGEIKGVAENLFKDLSIHFTRRLMLLTGVSLLIALGISYTVLTFSEENTLKNTSRKANNMQLRKIE